VRIENQETSVCAVLDVTLRTGRCQLANSYDTANMPSADELHKLSATARQVFDNPEVGNPSYNVALRHTQKLFVAVRTGEPQSTRSALRNGLAAVVNRARGRRDKGKWCARVGDASCVGADNDAAASVDDALSQATGAHPDKRGADGGGAAADDDGGGSGATPNGRADGGGSGAPLDVRADGGGAAADDDGGGPGATPNGRADGGNAAADEDGGGSGATPNGRADGGGAAAGADGVGSGATPNGRADSSGSGAPLNVRADCGGAAAHADGGGSGAPPNGRADGGGAAAHADGCGSGAPASGRADGGGAVAVPSTTTLVRRLAGVTS